MSAFTPFLRAIHDRPDDELPRLIFADFLDERGDWRGLLLRRPAPGGLCRDVDATRRWRDWLGPLPQNSWVACRRGLLHAILPAAAAFELRDSHPLKVVLSEGWIEHLDVVENEGQMPWAEQFELSELPSLGLQRTDDETLERLPVMPELRRLYLGHCGTSRAELRNLSDFPALEFVHVAIVDARSGDLMWLTATPHLKSLSLSGRNAVWNGPGPIGEFRELRRLHIHWGFWEDLAPIFAALPDLPHLSDLRLGGMPAGGQWVEQIARCRRLSRLRLDFNVRQADVEQFRRVRPDVWMVSFAQAC